MLLVKHKWWTLNNFNSNVSKALAIVIAYCVLHNYYEMWKILEFGRMNDATRRDNLARFWVGRLQTLKDGEQAKQARELMRRALFEQWLINHS
jgi:hypothetical protein